MPPEVIEGGFGSLTPKQERFARLVAEGAENLSQAYRSSYKAEGMSPASVHKEAHALTKNPKITRRIEALRAGQDRASATSIASNRNWVMTRLHEEAQDQGSPPGARIKALMGLGQALGLFNQTLTVQHDERSAVDVERELQTKLAALLD